MRFLTLVKGSEQAGPPPRALIEAIHRLGAEATTAGVLRETAGLFPSAVGARIRLVNGIMRVHEGPSATKEVVSAFAIYDVPTLEVAKEWAGRFMALHREHWKDWEGETEVRQILDMQL